MTEDDLYDELTQVNNALANLQRELARRNAQLEQTVRERDQLLGVAAHDLRTPLGIILSYSDFLETEALLTDEQRSFVATIKTTSRFMLDLIDGLLTVAVFESGQLHLAREVTDLGALVRHNVGLNRVLASKKQLEVALTAPDVGPIAEVDPNRIQQVLNNLIGNAIKFSPRGATIRVELAVTGAGVTVAVHDRGRGISARLLAGLFKPFPRGRLRGTEGEEGTGLGLTIARQVIEGHGGTITAASVVGQGSSFTFTLPAARIL